MAAQDDDDEEQMRSVALQNAQRILLARRQAEDALRKQSEWLRVALASIGDGVISTDAEGRVTFMNGVAETLTGWTQAEAVGRPLPEVFRIVNEVTRQPVDNPALRALREGTIVGLANHTVLVARDGKERPIDDSAAPMRDRDGATLGAVLVFRDVTERSRAEEARARLAAIVASSDDAIVGKTLDGVIRTWNAGAERLFGYTEEEAIGRPITLIIPPELLDEEQSILERIRRGERVDHFETIRATKDGRRLDISLAVSPIRDAEGRIIGASKVARDITDQKRSKEALRRSEQELLDFFENASVGLHWVGPDGTILRANRAELETLGYAREEYVGRHIAEFHADRTVIDDILRRLAAGETLQDYEARMVCKDGSVRDVLIDSSVMWAAGRFMHTRCFTRDVTDQKRAERRLAAQHAVTRVLAGSATLAEAAPEILRAICEHQGWEFGALWYVDQRDRVLRCSATWNSPSFQVPRFAAVTRESTFHAGVGLPGRIWASGEVAWIADVVADNNFPRISVAAAEGLHGGLACPIELDDDVLGVAEFFSREVRVPDEDLLRMMAGLGSQVGQFMERKRAEEGLARHLEREKGHARLLKRVADASLTIHAAGSLDSVLGVATAEARRIINAHRAVTSLTTGDDWAQAINAVSQSDEDEPARGYEARWTGQGIYAEVCRTNRPMRLTQAELEAHPAWRNFIGEGDDPPTPRGWLAAPFVSRTGRNLGLIQLSDKSEGEFTESDEAILVQLAQIASVAIENARLYTELREQDRRKDEFLALLAHELRNPLAPIRNGLQVMRLARDDPDAVAQARATMDRQLGHMVRLIDDLLDISRISQNKMELRRARVLLADVVGNAVETASPVIEAAGHELTVSIPPDPIFLDADLTRLAQVVSNLLTNSAKYTERGGRIWLSAERRGGEVVVSVKDNGLGIPAEALPRIFDMFSQVDRSVERSSGGLGIGLALVKGLVEMHGGAVTAESAGQGMGSTFTVRLPSAGTIEAPVLPALPEGGEPVACTRRRILVVDDNHDAANTLARLLKLRENDVRTAHDGVEAIEATNTFRPEVILMDVGMPRMNGYVAARRIREQPWGRSPVIIALTGWGQEGDRVQSREAGCDGHLVKPVDLPDLERLLDELMGRANCEPQGGSN